LKKILAQKANSSLLKVEDLSPIINSTRDIDIISNLLDLDIIPINVHSLMREIPLVNIYNYAITYDEYIKDMSESLTGSTMLFAQEPYFKFNLDSSLAFYKDFNASQGFVEDILKQITKDALRNNNSNALYQRMNTKLVRNTLFIVVLQHIIKQRVKQEIEFINTKVVSNTAAVSNQIDTARYGFDESGKLNPEALIDFDF
jgi:hypothetical protein